MAAMFILQNLSISDFWSLVATAVDINSNSWINLRFHNRIANDYLYYRSCGLGDFHKQEMQQSFHIEWITKISKKVQHYTAEILTWSTLAAGFRFTDPTVQNSNAVYTNIFIIKMNI